MRLDHEQEAVCRDEPQWSGLVEALHHCPRSFLPMKATESVTLIANVGIEGDRYAAGIGFYSDRPEPGRQISLFEVETLEALARDHKIVMTPAEHRRNVTTRGVPLNHLVGKRFRLGATLLEGTRLSVPCRHIEMITGLEIFTHFLNRCGLHARILEGGVVHNHDAIRPE